MDIIQCKAHQYRNRVISRTCRNCQENPLNKKCDLPKENCLIIHQALNNQDE